MKGNLPGAFVLSVLILAGCSKSKTPGPIDNGSTSKPKLEIVSGNNQTAKVGFYPADTIKVKAIGDGFDHSKYYVEFRGSGCNADLSISYSVLSDGTSAANYRLAGNIGAQTLQATLLELGTKKRIDSVTFNFTATAPAAGVNYTACTPPGTASSFTKTGSGRLFAIFGTQANLRYSDDEGISWNPVTGLNSSHAIRIVKSDGKNQVVAYSVIEDLYYSGDNGATWKLQNGSLKGISVGQVTYTSSGKLFVIASDNTFYYSVDNGDNWNTLTVTKDFGQISLISPLESTSGEFYVIVRGHGVFKSIDKGVTWNQLPDVTGGNGWDGSSGLYINPGNGWLYKSADDSAIAIYLSKDGGTTYKSVITTGTSADLILESNGALYFEGDGNIYKIDGSNNLIKIISTGQTQAADGDFIISNSGNIVFIGRSSLFLQYVKP